MIQYVDFSQDGSLAVIRWQGLYSNLPPKNNNGYLITEVAVVNLDIQLRIIHYQFSFNLPLAIEPSKLLHPRHVLLIGTPR